MGTLVNLQETGVWEQSVKINGENLRRWGSVRRGCCRGLSKRETIAKFLKRGWGEHGKKRTGWVVVKA